MEQVVGTELINRANALTNLESGDPERMVEVLLAIALYEPDGLWSEEICIKYSTDAADAVRGVAFLCFGHIARIHRTITRARVIPILQKGLKDPSAFVRGHADAALSDVLQYAPMR